MHSRVGRSFIAIRENVTAANGCGVNTSKYKIISFAISAFYVGFAGALYAHMVGFISPDTFVQNTSVIFITMLLFGGSGNLFGPVLGAVVITVIQEGLQSLSDYRMLIYGIFILVIILFQPHGISGMGEVFQGLQRDGEVMLMLKVTDLTINFSGLKAVDGLSFEIEQSEIFGLIGPNGAGKTTTFNMISGTFKPHPGKLN